MLQITDFKATDIDIVCEIQWAAYRPLYEKYRDDQTSPYKESREIILQKYQRPGTKGYLLLKNGQPVGTVRVSIDAECQTGRISALCVHPAYQGQGIAQHALLQIEKMHSDISRWQLDTILQEKGNCYLYEKLGYKRKECMEPLNDRMTLVFYEKVK